MAKITFTFEDTPNGTLIKSDPGLDELVALGASGDKVTSAQGYAMTTWLAVFAERKLTKKSATAKLH